MQYRIIAMRLNRVPIMPGGEAAPATTATLDLELLASTAGASMATQVTVSDWSAYQLDQVCELSPTPVAP
jgi:hypothetical protein